MAKTTQPNTIVVVDDEPHHVVWLVDFLESKRLKVEMASDIVDAIMRIEKEIYRTLVIDLNIPVTDPYREAVLERGGVYAKYRVCLSLKRPGTVDIETDKW